MGRGAGRRHISLTWMQRDPPTTPMPNQVALKDTLNSQVTGAPASLHLVTGFLQMSQGSLENQPHAH